MNNTFTYIGPFMGKPRMVASDKWKKRPVVERYWSFKAFMILQANLQKFEIKERVGIQIWIPMPQKSWSVKTKEAMARVPHQQKPDIDNIGKGIFDILTNDDSGIYDVRMIKLWHHDINAIDYEIKITNL